MDRREPGQESWGLGILTVGLAMAFPRQRVQGPHVAVTHRRRTPEHRGHQAAQTQEKPHSRASGLGPASGLSTCSATGAEGLEVNIAFSGP